MDESRTGEGSAAERPDEAAVAALVRVAREWAAAIVADDPVRIAGFMADEWVIVSGSGVTSKERFVALVASGELSHSAMELVTAPRVRFHGDTAVLTARMTNTAHYRGERHDADEWTTDVFVRRDGRWVCVLSHITPAA
ncbi:nuclear transport factor 2 family protein [Streptomyces sp. NPDC002328]|uniref:nuclear transport factor 2 family protein n=1 Tax=Streptomyces sp. NPDC002328 TaxID=3364642 RepID=UPI00369FC2B6